MILALLFTRAFAISLFLVARRLSDRWPCSKAREPPAPRMAVPISNRSELCPHTKTCNDKAMGSLSGDDDGAFKYLDRESEIYEDFLFNFSWTELTRVVLKKTFSSNNRLQISQLFVCDCEQIPYGIDGHFHFCSLMTSKVDSGRCDTSRKFFRPAHKLTIFLRQRPKMKA